MQTESLHSVWFYERLRLSHRRRSCRSVFGEVGSRLERLVVVFDTDSVHAAQTLAALGVQCDSWGFTLRHMKTLSSLRESLSNKEACIVFFDVRSNVGGHELADIQRQMMRANACTQVVYTGVSEQELVALECSDYAFMLPQSAEPQEVILAWEKALDRYNKHLEKPFVVKTKQRIHLVRPSRVSFAESVLRKVRIHEGDETVEVYAKLSDLMKKLPNNFVQCHKSYVVNMGCIQELSQGHVLLITGERIPISQQRRKEVREAFLTYIGRTV